VSVVIRELVHVSANLRLDGGGAAHLGREIGRAMRRYCARSGLRFYGLHLPATDGHPALDGYRSFGGSHARLGAALARLQLGGADRRALVFDHAGPARAQAWVPAPLRSRYAVFLLGIEVWHPLESDRRRALGGAFRLLPISHTTLARARPFLASAGSARVVHPGLGPEVPGGVADRETLEIAGERFVLIVSRMPGRERYKGHDELIDLWPALRRRLPDARLVVVGDGDDRHRLEDKARSLDLEGAVVFVGFSDPATLSALYRRCALFAMPSRGEGFGLVFLEAMKAGKPCVALSGTAPAEIIVDGVTGRLADDARKDELLAALTELLGDPGRAAALGAAGRRRFEDEYTFEAFERRLDPLLEELATRGSS